MDPIQRDRTASLFSHVEHQTIVLQNDFQNDFQNGFQIGLRGQTRTGSVQGPMQGRSVSPRQAGEKKGVLPKKRLKRQNKAIETNRCVYRNHIAGPPCTPSL